MVEPVKKPKNQPLPAPNTQQVSSQPTNQVFHFWHKDNPGRASHQPIPSKPKPLSSKEIEKIKERHFKGKILIITALVIIAVLIGLHSIPHNLSLQNPDFGKVFFVSGCFAGMFLLTGLLFTADKISETYKKTSKALSDKISKISQKLFAIYSSKPNKNSILRSPAFNRLFGTIDSK